MITFLIDRARRHWQVLSTLVLGVIISTAFLASGPLLVKTVMDFALPHKIRSSLEENGSVYLSTYNNQGAEAYEELDAEITNILVKNISEISEVVHGISSPWAFPWEEDTLIADERINLKSIAGIESRIEIIFGNWPETSGLELNSYQALISNQVSEAYNIEVGDRLPLSKKSSESEPSFWIEVAGIFQPLDARDPYWMINNNIFRSKNNSRYQSEHSVILLADEPTGQLDSNTGASIIRLLREIADQFGVTVIVASHEPNMILFADTIIELQDGKLVSLMRGLVVAEITSAAN